MSLLCDLCEDQPASVKCASCNGIGTGEQFCLECCEQLHSAAKTRGHALTDMEGRPRTASTAGAASVAAVSTSAKPAASSSTTAGGSIAVSTIPMCSLCDDVVATVQCSSCKNAAYCADCNSDFHMPAKQAGHTQLKFVLAGGSAADSDALPTTASIASPPLLPVQRTMSGTPGSIPPSPLLRSNSNLLRSPSLGATQQPLTPGSLPRNSLALIASATPGSASTRPRGMSLAMFARPGSAAGLNSPLSPTLGLGSSANGGSSFSKPFSLPGASAIKSPTSPGLSSSSSSHNLLPGVASIRSLAALDRLPSIDAAVPATSDEAKQCALCELDVATYRCEACDESFCDECNELSHTTAAKMAHTRTKISSAPSPTANAPLFPTPPPAAVAAAAPAAVVAPTPSKPPTVVVSATLAAPAGAVLPSTPPRSGSPSPAGSRRGSRRGSLKRPPGISTSLAAPVAVAIASAVKPAPAASTATTTTAAKPITTAAAAPAVAATPAAMCSVCEDETATVRCPDCKEDLCAGCDKQMHTPAKLAGHVRSAIGQTASTQAVATAAALLAAAPVAPRPSISAAAPLAVARPLPAPAPATAAPSAVPAAVVAKPAPAVAPVAATKPAVAAAPVAAVTKPPAVVVPPAAAAPKPVTPAPAAIAKPAAVVVAPVVTAAAAAATAKPAKVVMCDMCDDLVSAFKCDECEMALCADCDLSLHKPVKQSTHQRVPMSAVAVAAPVKPAAIVAPIAAAPIKPAIVAPAPVAAVKPPAAVPAPAAAKPAAATPTVVPAAIASPLKPATVVAPTPVVAKLVTPTPVAAAKTSVVAATPVASMCSICEDENATVRCPDCKEDLCAACDKDMHAPAKLAGHVRALIGQAAPTVAVATPVPAPLPTPAKLEPAPLKSPLLPSPPVAAAAPTTTTTVAAPQKTVVSPRPVAVPVPTLVLQPSKPSTPTVVLSPRGQPSPKVLADRAAFDKQLLGGADRPPSVIPPPVDVSSRPPSTTAPPSQTSTRASSIARFGSITAAASSVVSSSAASSGLESDTALDPLDTVDLLDLEFDMGEMELDGADPFEIETLESLPASRHSPVHSAQPVADVAAVASSPTTSAAASAAQSQAQQASAREEDRSSSSRQRDRDRDSGRRSHADRSDSRNESRGADSRSESRSSHRHQHQHQQQPSSAEFVPSSYSGPLHRHYSVHSGDDGSDRDLDRERDARRRREAEDDFEDDSQHPRFLHVRPPSQLHGSSPYRETHTPTPPPFASPRKSSLKSPRDSRAPHTPGSRQGFREEFEPDSYSTAFDRSSRTKRDARDRDRISHRHHRSRSRLGSSSGGDRGVSPVSAIGADLSDTVSALVGSNHQAASLLQQLLSVLHRPEGAESDGAHPATALMQIAQMATTAALDLDTHHSPPPQLQHWDDAEMQSPRMQHASSSSPLVSMQRHSSSRSSILSPRKQTPAAPALTAAALHSRKAARSRASRLLLREGATPISADQASLNEAWLARKLRERLAASQQHAREGLHVPAATYAPLTPQPPPHAPYSWAPPRPGSADAFPARPSTTPSAFAAAFAAGMQHGHMFHSPTAAAAVTAEAAAASTHPHAYAWAPVQPQPMHAASVAASPFVPAPPPSASPLSAAAAASSVLASPAATAAVFASLMARGADGSQMSLPVASSPHQHAMAVAAATAAYHAARQSTVQMHATQMHATQSPPPPLSYASYSPQLSSHAPPMPLPLHSPALHANSPLSSSVHLTYASPGGP